MAGAAPDPEECPICGILLHNGTPLHIAHTVYSSTGEAIHHQFHKECIRPWVNAAFSQGRRPSCPICRNVVDVERNLRTIDPALLPIVRISFNGVAVAITGNILLNLMAGHAALAEAATPLPMYPGGVPPGEAVPAGWAEQLIPAHAAEMVQPDLWNNTYFLVAIISIILIFNTIIMERLHIMTMRRLLGGGPTNTSKQLCINETCYEVDSTMAPLITEAINALQKYVNSIKTTEGGSRRTYKKSKKSSKIRHTKRCR